MSTILTPVVTGFARDVLEGLTMPGQKRLSSKYLYDDLGSALFEAITLLPEYGLTRADERLLENHSPNIAHAAGSVQTVCELGSGSGKKTRHILRAMAASNDALVYSPIDVSPAALDVCAKEVSDLALVSPVCADWVEGLTEISSKRSPGPLLVLFLGSSIGNLDRSSLPDFLSQISGVLKPGDLFLLGADLVKDIDTMLAAYDDPTCVTAAFNLNILARMNREFDADFDLRSFAHEARWNSEQRRIEMHLLSGRDQTVVLRGLDASIEFEAGETIWTESSHKFSEDELLSLAEVSGFLAVDMWIDREWPFAEALWKRRA